MNSKGSSFPYRYTHTLMTVQKPPYNFARRTQWVKPCIDRFNRETSIGNIIAFQVSSDGIMLTYGVACPLDRPGCALARFSRFLIEEKVPGIEEKIEKGRLLQSVSLDEAQPNCDDESTAEAVDVESL